MFDPTLHPHLAKALAMHDAQYDYDEHGAPATEQFRDYCDRVRDEARRKAIEEMRSAETALDHECNSTTVGDLTFTIQSDGSIRVDHKGPWWTIDQQCALVALLRDHARLRRAREDACRVKESDATIQAIEREVVAFLRHAAKLAAEGEDCFRMGSSDRAIALVDAAEAIERGAHRAVSE